MAGAFLNGPALLVVIVSSSSVRAWIWRCTAAGLMAVWVSARIALSSSKTLSWRSARRCGVVARSYFLDTFAPVRTFDTSFCCGQK